VVITGDIMMARAVGARIKAGPSDSLFPFADTADVLKSHDLRIGNLECVVSTLGSPQPKTYTFEAPLQAFERLRAAGFQIVSVANNHSGDYGKAAFSDMLTHLPTYGITPVGGGANRTEAHRLVTYQVRTTKIGILAYCEIEPSSFAATASTPGHAWLEATAMKQDIAAARSQVDFLIVFTHWGVEYVLQENAHQQYMARLAVDASRPRRGGAPACHRALRDVPWEAHHLQPGQLCLRRDARCHRARQRPLTHRPGLPSARLEAARDTHRVFHRRPGVGLTEASFRRL